MHLRATSIKRTTEAPEIVTHGSEEAVGGIVEVKSKPLLPLGQALLILFSASGQTAQEHVIQSLDFIAGESDGLASILEPVCYQLMKRKQEREIDYELGRLHELRPTLFNRTLLTLIASKDLVVRTAAAKMVLIITRHHFETGKLLAKAPTTTKAKIEIISSFSTSSFTLIESTHANALEELAETLLGDLLKEMQTPKPTLLAVTFADAVAVLLRAISHTTRNPDLHTDENSSKRSERLAQTLDELYTKYLSTLHSWWTLDRPLRGVLIASLLRLGESSEAKLHLAGELFGELVESETAHLTASELPIASHLRLLSESLPTTTASATTTSEPTKHFEKIFKVAVKLSHASPVVSAALVKNHGPLITSTLLQVLFSPSVEEEEARLASAILRFIKISAADFDARFWEAMANSTPAKHVKEVFRLFTALSRTSEARLTLLNRILKSWTGADPLKSNCHALLLFILKHPEDSKELFPLLNSYVTKNVNISKLQALVLEAQQL